MSTFFPVDEAARTEFYFAVCTQLPAMPHYMPVCISTASATKTVVSSCILLFLHLNTYLGTKRRA